MSTRAIQIGFLLSGVIDPTTATPLNAGTAYFYEAGTATPKNVWTEKEKTNAYTSYTLSTGGIAQLYGDGIYKVIIKDSDDSIIYTWDNIKIRANNYSIVSKAAAYNVTADDDVVLVNTSSTAVTINMLAAASMEYPVVIAHIAGTNAITIEPDGSETIDGDANYSFTSVNSAIQVISDGSNLVKVGNAAITLIDGATITLANTGLHILDTDASHDLIIKPGSNLTADKTLTITTGDADRTLSIEADSVVNQDLSSDASPTLADLTLTDLTASKVVVTDGDKLLESAAALNVAMGGTGVNALTDHCIFIGSGTTAVTILAAMTNGQLLIGATGADPAPQTMGGDATLAANGTLTIGSDKILQAKIKTAWVESSFDITQSDSHSFDPPGGEFGFSSFKVKGETTDVDFDGWTTGAVTTGYVYAKLQMTNNDAGNARFGYIEQKYITAS